MNKNNCACLALALLALTLTATQVRGQLIYTPYAFTNFAGLPGDVGSVDGTGSDARFNVPQGLALDSAGNLYVADEKNGAVRKITPNGVVTTLTTGFVRPTGLALDSAGNIYVGNTYNHTIDKIALVGTNWVVTTLAGTAGLQGSDNGTNGAALFKYPTGVAVDSATNIYVADYLNALIRKLTPVGTDWVVTTLAGLGGQFQYPDGVAVDGTGNVYVADEGRQTIQKVTPAGTVTTLAGSAGVCGSKDGPAGAALFCRPHGVAVDSATNIYVADYYTNTIRKISPVGANWVVTTLAGSPGDCDSADGPGSAARFCGPNGLVVDNAGRLFLADGSNYRISKGVPSILTISRKINGIVHHFSPPHSPFPASLYDEIIFDTAGLTNIDLSQYGTFELRFFAPAGQRIVVNSPTNFTSSLSLYYVAVSDGSSNPTTNNTVNFENFSGVLPIRTYSFFAVADAGNAVVFDANHSYTDAIEFTAIKYAFTPTYNPANSSKTFQLPIGGTDFLTFAYPISQSTDPGSFVSLSPVIPLTAGVQATPGNVNISWLSKLGQHYQVQCVTNLLATNNWVNYGPELIGDGLSKTLADPTTNGLSKYYRIKVLP